MLKLAVILLLSALWLGPSSLSAQSQTSNNSDVEVINQTFLKDADGQEDCSRFLQIELEANSGVLTHFKATTHQNQQDTCPLPGPQNHDWSDGLELFHYNTTICGSREYITKNYFDIQDETSDYYFVTDNRGFSENSQFCSGPAIHDFQVIRAVRTAGDVAYEYYSPTPPPPPEWEPCTLANYNSLIEFLNSAEGKTFEGVPLESRMIVNGTHNPSLTTYFRPSCSGDSAYADITVLDDRLFERDPQYRWDTDPNNPPAITDIVAHIDSNDQLADFQIHLSNDFSFYLYRDSLTGLFGEIVYFETNAQSVIMPQVVGFLEFPCEARHFQRLRDFLSDHWYDTEGAYYFDSNPRRDFETPRPDNLRGDPSETFVYLSCNQDKVYWEMITPNAKPPSLPNYDWSTANTGPARITRITPGIQPHSNLAMMSLTTLRHGAQEYPFDFVFFEPYWDNPVSASILYRTAGWMGLTGELWGR